MRQASIGTKTMVVSPHALASAAGARILAKGGNAFDAAVAVSSTLAVVYPHMTGLGGDSFWLLYSPGEGAVRGYNGSGRSGYKASPEAYAGEQAIPTRGIRSVLTVPGMVDSWSAILREYGTLPLGDVLEPAMTYAGAGYPVSRSQYANTKLCAGLLAANPYSAAAYLRSGGVPPAGTRWIQSGLAQSLRRIASNGRDEFYRGELARDITSYIRKSGGLLLADDFADHEGNWVTPLTGSYRDLELYQLPPNSQGFTGIVIAQMLEHFDFNSIPHGSVAFYHVLVEAVKLAFRDRNLELTDPDFRNIPVERFLDKAYCRELAGRISRDSAALLTAEPLGSDTAYAAVVDGDGNAVSFIQSLYFEFGSGVTAGETGILLQNRGSFFSLDESSANRLEPRKRTFHTLMPALALKDEKPYLLYGSMGGEGQPQTQTALLTRIVDYRMDPQEAINEPRWVWGRTWGEASTELKMEARVGEQVLSGLAAMGHEVRKIGDWDALTGHAQAILLDAHGFRIGGSDPRSDGAAIGW